MKCENCGLEEITMITSAFSGTDAVFWCPECGALFRKAPNWSYWQIPKKDKEKGNGHNRGA